MITVYCMTPGGIRTVLFTAPFLMPPGAVWFDALEPTPEEHAALSRLLNIELPTHDDVHEVELSNRLYLGQGASYMTLDVPVRAGRRTESHAMMFILLERHLVTLRFKELAPVRDFQARALQSTEVLASSEVAFIGLLEEIIAQSGALLRDLAGELERVSQLTFWDPSSEDRHLRTSVALRSALTDIGNSGERSSKVQQALLSLDRVLSFHSEYAKPRAGSPLALRIQTMQRDAVSLVENAEFLSQKAGFLLDATLGFINAEQNQIIKIFSVAAVIFLPPTLIASIYGMNFTIMPELTWPYGYPFAIGLMLIAAFLPYALFKRRGWI